MLEIDKKINELNLFQTGQDTIITDKLNLGLRVECVGVPLSLVAGKIIFFGGP
jgi:hypothetical protein